MTPALLAAIKASLPSPAHAWDLLGVHEHVHTEAGAEGEAPVSTAMRTYQLASAPLGLFLTIGIDGGVATVTYEGTTFRTGDAGLLAALDAIAAAHLPGIEADFIAHLTREVT